MRMMLRLVAVVVAMMQLVLVSASLLEANEARSAISHAEPLGVRLHFGHDAAECAGCTIRHLTVEPTDPPVAAGEIVFVVSRADAEPIAPARLLHVSARLSRAPPVA